MCDCQAAAILEALTSLGGTAKDRAATCNAEPSTSLTTGSDVPCSPVRVATVVNTTETTALISWTYSNRTEIDQFASTFEFNGFVGTFFRNAVDQFIQLNTSTLSASDASEILRGCEAVFLASGAANANVWAFQFLLTNSRTTELTERCLFVNDSAINRIPQLGLAEHFDLTVDVEPGETYRLRARPVVLRFASEELVDFRFGPLSNEVIIVAQDARPSGPVVDLIAQSREDDRVALQWSPPIKANGAIVRYVLVRETLSQSEGVSSNLTVETGQTFITLTGLTGSSTYKVTVFAETSKGAGPSEETIVKTCRENMRTLDGDAGTCVAKRGFFLDAS